MGESPVPPKLELKPDLAGKGSRLILDIPGGESAGGARPTSSVLGLQRGFVIDVRARRARCTTQQAEAFACPAASRIGAGYALAYATGALVPGGARTYRAELDAFLAPRQRRGDLARVVISVFEPENKLRGNVYGRLVSRPRQAFGQQLRFDALPGAGEPPPGVEVTLQRLHLEVGAFRAVRRNRRRIRFTLIRNPQRCGGSWKARGRVGFADGTSRTTYLRAGCRPA